MTDHSDEETANTNIVPSPAPTIEAEFHVLPHPDPIVRALIAEIQSLREENARLTAELQERNT